MPITPPLGAAFNGDWIHARWDSLLPHAKDLHINDKEVLTLEPIFWWSGVFTFRIFCMYLPGISNAVAYLGYIDISPSTKLNTVRALIRHLPHKKPPKFLLLQ